MELYELNLHFPGSYKTLGNREITLTSTEYYESDERAIERAKIVASSFVTPKPDYFYLEDATGRKVWTDYPEEVKRAIRYELLASKPVIMPITNND